MVIVMAKKGKKRQISFLVTEEMLEFLKKRASLVGNRSEYLRHLVISDMFGQSSSRHDLAVRQERKKQLDKLSKGEKNLRRSLNNELKETFKKLRVDEDDSSGQPGTSGDGDRDQEV
jgi:IS30 family transposase